MARWQTAVRQSVVAGLLLGAAAFAVPAAVDRAKAAGVMAAYLRHIAALTTWPEAVADADRPIVIGVVGDDPNDVMGPIRSRIGGEGLLAQGRPIEVVDVPAGSLEQGLDGLLERCGLMFFSDGSEQAWARIEPAVASRPIVTVSEMDGFARRGGMVEYFIDLDSGKVRMIVNLEAMKRAGVLISARLLALESVIVMRREEDV